MKGKIVLSCICLSILLTSSYAESLRDSVQRVITTNPDILAEKINQEAYKYYVDEREGRYLPTLDFEAYLETAEIKKDYKDNRATTKTEEDGYNAAIIFRQYIYDGGLTPSQVEEAKHQELANRYRSLYAIENTVLETIKSYNSLVQYDERMFLSQNMIKVHEENLQTAKEKEQISGEVLETYQVSSKLHFVTDSYIEEQDLKESELANFERYVGREPIGKICRPVVDETKVPSTLKEAIKIAVLRNYRIQEQLETIKLQREKIIQYNATFLPSLNIEFKASVDQDLALDEAGREDDWYGRLNFNWNLFNGNRDSIRSEQEKKFLQEHKKTLDDITNEIVAEVKSLYSKYTKNKKRVEQLKKYVEANVNIVEVYRNEFEAGTRTFVDILDAESELYSSSKSLINMEYTSLNNYYELLFNLSTLTDTVLTSSNQNCDNVEPRILNYIPKKQKKNTASELEGLISMDDSALIKKELGLYDDEVMPTSAATSSLFDQELGEKASNDAMTMISNGYKSFLEAPNNYYTINVATKSGIKNAKEFIESNNLGDKGYAFEFGPDRKNAKVIYGVYSSVKEAKEAMNHLAPDVLQNKPYVDNISKHQKLYLKYN